MSNLKNIKSFDEFSKLNEGADVKYFGSWMDKFADDIDAFEREWAEEIERNGFQEHYDTNIRKELDKMRKSVEVATKIIGRTKQ